MVGLNSNEHIHNTYKDDMVLKNTHHTEIVIDSLHKHGWGRPVYQRQDVWLINRWQRDNYRKRCTPINRPSVDWNRISKLLSGSDNYFYEITFERLSLINNLNLIQYSLVPNQWKSLEN